MARRTRRGADSRKGELRVALIGAAAVLVAAVVTGLLSRGGPTHSPYRAHLQVLDLQVTNGPPPARGGQTYDAARAAGVVVTLRNPGDGVSVVTRARFVVEHFARLAATPDCIPGAGPIPVSANYRVQLAPLAHAGETFSAPLSQEVRANGDDRVRIGFTQYESTAYPGPYVNGYGTGNASLYQLRVELFHDGEPKPVRAGTILIALPFPWSGLFPGGQGRAFICNAMARNPGTLRRMLALPGRRSDTLAAFGRDPAMYACAEQERSDPDCDRRAGRRASGAVTTGGGASSG